MKINPTKMPSWSNKREKFFLIIFRNFQLSFCINLMTWENPNNYALILEKWYCPIVPIYNLQCRKKLQSTFSYHIYIYSFHQCFPWPSLTLCHSLEIIFWSNRYGTCLFSEIIFHYFRQAIWVIFISLLITPQIRTIL